MFVSSITGVDNTACEIPPYKLQLDTHDPISGLPLNPQQLQDVGYGRLCDDTATDGELMVTQVNQASDDGFNDHTAEEDSKGLERLNEDTEVLENLEAFTTDSTGCTANPLANNRTINTDVGCRIGGDMMLVVDYMKQGMDIDSSSLNCDQSCANQQTAQSSQSDTRDNDTATLKPAERGTQIQFKGLNLEESTSSLRGNKIVFTLECNRCKQRIDQQLSASG